MALAVAWSAWWLRMEGQSLAAVPALLCVLGALLAHAGVNVLNEVHDFRSGLDQHTWRTPFSGGSGALLSHPDKVKTAATLGWTCVVLTAAIGLGLWWWHPAAHGPLMALGGLGLLLVVGLIFVLAWLMHRLRAGGFILCDTQFLTPHLASLGAVEIPRSEYQIRLALAMSLNANFDPAGYHPLPSSVVPASP